MHAPSLRYLVHDVILHPVRNEKDLQWTLDLYCVLNCNAQSSLWRGSLLDTRSNIKGFR